MSDRGFSESAAVPLSTSYAVLTLNGVPSGASDVADQIRLGLAELALTSIAGGATQVTWYLARDANRDEPITDEITADIISGATLAAGGCAGSLNGLPFVTSGGALYVAAKLDAGTASAVARLTWER
jgi:hypothetical protein